jgi:hypothetical protein
MTGRQGSVNLRPNYHYELVKEPSKLQRPALAAWRFYFYVRTSTKVGNYIEPSNSYKLFTQLREIFRLPYATEKSGFTSARRRTRKKHSCSPRPILSTSL